MKKYIKNEIIQSLFLILLINSLLFEKGGCLYDEIIDALQNSGDYGIIELLKIWFEEDLAYQFCIDIPIPKTICQYIIKVIIGDYRPSSNPSKNDIEDVLSKINATKKFKEVIRDIYKKADNKSRRIIYIITTDYNVLILKKKEYEIIALIKKLLKI